MYQIQNLTDNSRQKQTLVLPDGSKIDLSIYFVPAQLGWFITELVYGSFVLNNVRITNSPNMLYQFRNKIPFGLACFTKGNREPSQIQDLLLGNTTLFILSAEEVDQYREFLSG